MSDRWFAKKPCVHCPFRRDVTPFLHPERAEEISQAASNRYAEFHCHKTLEHDEEGDGDTMVVATSLVCAGFLAMQINDAGIECPEGFEPDDGVYSDHYDMTEAYEIEWERKHARR